MKIAIILCFLLIGCSSYTVTPTAEKINDCVHEYMKLGEHGIDAVSMCERIHKR